MPEQTNKCAWCDNHVENNDMYICQECGEVKDILPANYQTVKEVDGRLYIIDENDKHRRYGFNPDMRSWFDTADEASGYWRHRRIMNNMVEASLKHQANMIKSVLGFTGVEDYKIKDKVYESNNDKLDCTCTDTIIVLEGCGGDEGDTPEVYMAKKCIQCETVLESHLVSDPDLTANPMFQLRAKQLWDCIEHLNEFVFNKESQ